MSPVTWQLLRDEQPGIIVQRCMISDSPIGLSGQLLKRESVLLYDPNCLNISGEIALFRAHYTGLSTRNGAKLRESSLNFA